jgi:hypothetical protein
MKCNDCIWLNVKDKETSCADIGILPTAEPCNYFDSTKDRIIQIKAVYSKLERNIDKVKDENWKWLNHLTASQAFLVCIGAGPWKIGRRTLIQNQAVAGLENNDLSQIKNVACFKYPLDWQNQKVNDLIAYLNRYSLTMNQYVYYLKSIGPCAAQHLYKSTKTKGRAKVLDLFIRDYLKAAAFPIDRWVKRSLNAYGLPLHENFLLELCGFAGINPRYMARLLVEEDGFSGNGEIKR